jgi:hypothetical protein
MVFLTNSVQKILQHYDKKSNKNFLLGCGVAQIVAHQLVVRQARVRISARHPREGPLPSGCNEDTKSSSLRVVYITIV